MKKTVFTSPHGLPYSFTIEIIEQQEGITFHVSQEQGIEVKKELYHLNTTLHASYSNMFEKLHFDFGFRLPQSREPHVKPTFKANYSELLLSNLHKGMLYGYGDPAVIRVEGKVSCYYVVSTSNDAPDVFPIVCSENLTDWKFSGYVFPKGHTPQWALDGPLISDYWAPEMHKVGDEYRVYFVARSKETSELCIGLAKSASPRGPFVPEQQPLLKGNVIDPHLFIQDENTSYLFWKEDNNDIWPGTLIDLLCQWPTLIPTLFTEEKDRALASFILTLKPWLQEIGPMERFLFMQVFIESVTTRFTVACNLLHEIARVQPAIAAQIKVLLQFMKTPMYARQLTADGCSFIGDKTRILENDLDWEAHLVEGMWVSQYKNKYFLFYAGNDFSTDQYGIGLAIADAVLGPYKKLDAPILASSEKWPAPGHPSVTIAPNGKPIMLLHAFLPGKVGYKQFRALLGIEIDFEAYLK
jgi:arabinan endo-1,5-alpha-L-arabinosidase